MKKYKTALVVGRFQPLHNGHIKMIFEAIKNAEKVIILISSAQESRTLINPFTYEERKMMLELVTNTLSSNIEIKAINDIGVGNNSSWGDYVLDVANEQIDLFVTGLEERRANWFENNSSIDVLTVKKEIPISATNIRKSMVDDNSADWVSNTPMVLWDYFKSILIPILKTVTNNHTDSI